MINLEHIAPEDWAAVERVRLALQSLVVDTGGQSLSMRAGTVAANGTIIRGQGFTVNKTGVGLYTIVQPWVKAPVVTVTLGSTAALTGVAVSTNPSTTGFGVATFNAGGLVDGMFHWVAIG